jgi:uncharacterized membrane protein YgdD (TMEM256/DUF423 family)
MKIIATAAALLGLAAFTSGAFAATASAESAARRLHHPAHHTMAHRMDHRALATKTPSRDSTQNPTGQSDEGGALAVPGSDAAFMNLDPHDKNARYGY